MESVALNNLPKFKEATYLKVFLESAKNDGIVDGDLIEILNIFQGKFDDVGLDITYHSVAKLFIDEDFSVWVKVFKNIDSWKFIRLMDICHSSSPLEVTFYEVQCQNYYLINLYYGG